MPVEYDIRSREGLIHVRYMGEVTPDEVLDSFREFRGRPEFSFALTHLVDVTEVTGASAGFAEMFKLFSTFTRVYSSAAAVMRVAIYAPSEFAFGLARIFENLSETSDAIETRVFDDFSAAQQWARRPEPADH